MIRQLAKSIREYKRASIATPILVSFEVLMECTIPFIIARLVNEVKGGCDMEEILGYGGILVCMAILSLLFGGLAGSTCATASCGLARNLRKDMFYSIQGYSFENIDKFMTSSLVTRMTTDITNVQNAYMMIIRTAIRSPLMLIFAFVMAFVMGGRMAWIFLLWCRSWPSDCHWLFIRPCPSSGECLKIRQTEQLYSGEYQSHAGSEVFCSGRL